MTSHVRYGECGQRVKRERGQPWARSLEATDQNVEGYLNAQFRFNVRAFAPTA